MFIRKKYLEEIKARFSVNPIVAILGPRQCGKTTLARTYIKSKEFPSENYFDLEDPTDLMRLDNPKTALSMLSGLIVIDEIQRAPEIFPILRVLVDRSDNDLQLLILGSASRELIRQSSETLAGRISYIQLTPLSLSEIEHPEDLNKLWYRGGFPRSFLAESDNQSALWRKDYIRTFLERDIIQLGFNVSSQQLRKFWMMLTAYHGNIFNASELGLSLQQNYKTMQHYLEILQGTFMVRVLSPWFENILKRQVKSPKIYFRDSGLFHTLLNINHFSGMIRHVKLGASWEGFALEEIIRYYDVEDEDCYFWATQGVAELDLLLFKDGKKLGFEFKYNDAPRFTPSMRKAMENLNLDSLTIVYPGDKNAQLDEQIFLLALKSLSGKVSYPKAALR